MFFRMGHFIVYFIIIFFINGCCFFGCGDDYDDYVEKFKYNTLVSAQIIDEVNSSIMLKVVKNSIDKNATNAFGYRAVKIIYKTLTPNNKEVNASGLLVIPIINHNDNDTLNPVICDNHGTIFKNEDAPTLVEKNDSMPNYPLAILMSGYARFITIAPDYLGYGESKGEVHPYIMKSGARASLDMIIASFNYMVRNEIPFDSRLFISGYSEGGYVAMSLAKEIEKDHLFTLRGVTPMAGPYNVAALGSYELNASKKMVVPAFLAEIGWSYSYYYDDIDIYDLMVKADIFKKENLFGGDYNMSQIHEALGLADLSKGDIGIGTHYTKELFKEDFINNYHNDVTNPVRVHFEENNAYNNWIPKAPVNLIQCKEDEIIPFELSTKRAYSKLNTTEANVTLTVIDSSQIPPQTQENPLVHQRCSAKAYGLAIEWFNKIVKENNE